MTKACHAAVSAAGSNSRSEDSTAMSAMFASPGQLRADGAAALALVALVALVGAEHVLRRLHTTGIEEEQAARHVAVRRVPVGASGVARDRGGGSEADLDPVLGDVVDRSVAGDGDRREGGVDAAVRDDPGLLV